VLPPRKALHPIDMTTLELNKVCCIEGLVSLAFDDVMKAALIHEVRFIRLSVVTDGDVKCEDVRFPGTVFQRYCSPFRLPLFYLLPVT